MAESIDETVGRVADWYTRALDRHGAVAASVGWRDEEAQRLRFSKLAELFSGEREAVAVADLGCGYGALFQFLSELPGLELARYVGYDLSAKMIAAGRERVHDSRASFVECGHLVEDVDYSIVSGTFNVRLDATEERWAEHVRATLDELNERSRRGFAFNLLSTYVDWKQDDLFYADPAEWFDLCKRRYSRFVSLLHDYPLFEWTIVVRRGN